MNKPILFLCSSYDALDIQNLYYLQSLGKVLNLNDERLKDDDIKQWQQYQFIIVNYLKKDQVEKLRFIQMENVSRVCVCRKYESSTSDWIEKCKPDFTIKRFDFVKTTATIQELYNFIKHIAVYKQPVSSFRLYGGKILSLFLSCIGRSS